MRACHAAAGLPVACPTSSIHPQTFIPGVLSAWCCSVLLSLCAHVPPLPSLLPMLLSLCLLAPLLACSSRLFPAPACTLLQYQVSCAQREHSVNTAQIEAGRPAVLRPSTSFKGWAGERRGVRTKLGG